jgi:hypothetical protein
VECDPVLTGNSRFAVPCGLLVAWRPERKRVRVLPGGWVAGGIGVARRFLDELVLFGLVVLLIRRWVLGGNPALLFLFFSLTLFHKKKLPGSSPDNPAPRSLPQGGDEGSNEIHLEKHAQVAGSVIKDSEIHARAAVENY